MNSIEENLLALRTAHDDVIAVIAALPDAALEWRPSDGEWSLKQMLSHLAHANDFYVMISDEVRTRNFSSLLLHPDLPGFKRMTITDAEVAQCTAASAIQRCFEQAFERLLAALQSLTLAELDQPFSLSYAWKSDAESVTTTLRQRVIETAATHMREHRVQLVDTFTRWQAAHNEHCEAE